VLYVLAEEWLVRRQTLAAMQVRDLDRLDDVLAEAAEPPKPPADRASRSAEIAAFVAATGGAL
jgi:hypothetical protein